jgi:hypothetical protein
MQFLSAVLVSLLAAGCMEGCAAQDMTVPIPPGETPVESIGVYEVAYQPYGGDVVDMPVSWVGNFETVSGISYVPGDQVLDRPSILIHSPWRVKPGQVWVDYHLKLPKITPISLRFGIAMRPDAVEPGRSDGVTFSTMVVADDGAQWLMRQFWAQGRWKDYDLDLSRYAGQTVTLRLQTEPGPANDPGFDYSYFGGAKIVAGTAVDATEELLTRMTSSQAYQATEDVSLAALANDRGNGVIPSNLLVYTNAVERAGDGYDFTYQADDCRVVYHYAPETGTLDDVRVRVDGGNVFRPALGGGVSAIPTGESAEVPLRGGRAVEAALGDDQALKVVWEYDLAGDPLRVTWGFAIVGKALRVTAASDDTRVTHFTLGGVGDAPLRRTFYIPYMPADWGRGAVSFLPASALFVTRYLDWTVSHSSRCPQGESYYDTKTDGTRNALVESGYVSVSPNMNEVLPNTPWPASPYKAELGPRVMLDIWNQHNGTYAGSGENLRDLKDNGVDHLAIINHVWQRFGYDVKLPDHIPADPRMGGEESMIAFGKAANDCGYVWSLHENYIDIYPDAPSYDATARVLQADGKPSPAWFNGSVQSYGLKTNRALGYAKLNAPYIHEHYGTTAAYLDVHTCVPPWHQLDHEAGQPMAAMALAKVKYDSELFQYMRDTHHGPLFGEGANQFYWAGQCDGVEAQVAGGENHTPLVDFDLLKLHPQMVNHGMGYYERWFTAGYNHRWGFDTGTVEQVDKYRAQELAYGHAGFVGAAQVDNVQWVAKEHHLMHAVQRLYGTANPVGVLYEVRGQLVTGSVALALGDTARQQVSYDSGLTVWVNWSAQPWAVEGRVLPQWGFLALGPDTEVYTALRDGKFADYAECPEYVFADARTSFNMPYLNPGKDIEPRLKDFAYLGGRRIRVTYEWVVNDTLSQDYHCFVHLTNAQSAGADKIVGQQDHGLPVPTRQWRKGQVITDGPYEIDLPDAAFNTYDLVIGLYKDDRAQLKGVQAGGGRIMLGRLMVAREGGQVTGVKLGEFKDVIDAQGPQVDFGARLNPAGTWADFGTVATDGSAKVNRGADALTVFPYPRGKEFTVALDLGRLAGRAVDPRAAKVRALAAGTQADLGEVACQVEKGRLVFQAGTAGAGRHVVRW